MYITLYMQDFVRVCVCVCVGVGGHVCIYVGHQSFVISSCPLPFPLPPTYLPTYLSTSHNESDRIESNRIELDGKLGKKEDTSTRLD